MDCLLVYGMDGDDIEEGVKMQTTGEAKKTHTASSILIRILRINDYDNNVEVGCFFFVGLLRRANGAKM